MNFLAGTSIGFLGPLIFTVMNPTSTTDLKAIIATIKVETMCSSEPDQPAERENGLTDELRAAINDLPKFKAYLKAAVFVS